MKAFPLLYAFLKEDKTILSVQPRIPSFAPLHSQKCHFIFSPPSPMPETGIFEELKEIKGTQKELSSLEGPARRGAALLLPFDLRVSATELPLAFDVSPCRLFSRSRTGLLQHDCSWISAAGGTKLYSSSFYTFQSCQSLG